MTVHDTPERTLLRDQVTRFVAHDVEPYGDAWEREGCVPRGVQLDYHWQGASGGVLGLRDGRRR